MTKLYPNKKTTWLHCKPNDITAYFSPELTAYRNADDLLYIQIEDTGADHDYNSQHIVFDLDTAIDFVAQLQTIINEMTGE